MLDPQNLADAISGKDSIPSRTCRKENAMHLRVAVVGDARAMTAVINAAFRRAESFLVDRNRIDLDSVKNLFEKGSFLVADECGVIAGCVYVELRGERAYLGLLSVDPERQRAGLGAKLMNAAEDFSAKSGCRFVDLQIVNVRKELPAFYHRMGYAETGTAPFPSDIKTKIPCHFVRMSKQLI
jgi:predicted N-acetyltransferase YhbS